MCVFHSVYTLTHPLTHIHTYTHAHTRRCDCAGNDRSPRPIRIRSGRPRRLQGFENERHNRSETDHPSASPRVRQQNGETEEDQAE